MSCDKPITVWRTADGIAFEKPRNVAWPEQLEIPCRRCTGCRLDHRQDWALRMMHELYWYQNAEFVTLTYSDENIPSDYSLQQSDMQKFFKRLRKAQPESDIRYVYSGEYGDSTSRPHYHAIIFGLSLNDKDPFMRNERGEILYKSKDLAAIWGNGIVSLGKVTPQSAGYVAGYMLKDIKGNYDPKTPYMIVDPKTGEAVERVRPYARYSQKPAIGKRYIDRYYQDVFPDDFIVPPSGWQSGNSDAKPMQQIQHPGSILAAGYKIAKPDPRRLPVPTYYSKRLEQLDPDLSEVVKLKRIEALIALKQTGELTEARREVKAEVRDAKIKNNKTGTKYSEPARIVLRSSLPEPEFHGEVNKRVASI